MRSLLSVSVWILVGIAGATAGGLAVVAGSDGAGARMRVGMQTAASTMLDAASIFALRSPGERAPGALTQSKPLRAPAARAVATSRRPPAATQAIVRPASKGPAGTAAPAALLYDPLAPNAGSTGDKGVIAAIDIAEALAPGGPSFGAPGGGLVAAPIGGFAVAPPVPNMPPPSGAEPPSTPAMPVPPTPVSAVPEPGTWMTMILGLFLIAGTMRRRIRRNGVSLATLG